jgi:anti-sigma factor RsiW
MRQTFQCGDNPALVGYLYDECEPDERAAIAAHVAICAACTAELAALDSTRVQLKAWTPPEADLGFTIVRAGASTSPESRGLRSGAFAWSSQFVRPLPAWAQVAAASLIFGAGLWLGIVRGTQPGTATPSAAVASVTPAAASASQLTDLERRLRAEIAQLRTSPSPTTASVPQNASNAQLLAQVRQMIAESEQRQQNQLALRTTQVMRDFDTQRRADLTQIQNNLGQIEGLTGAEVKEQRQMLNYLMRVSQQGQ